MSGATYWQWGIPIAVLLVLAIFVGSVYLAERSKQRGDRGIAPRDRWLAGGLFRGDPRAMTSRDEVPGPDELRPAQEAGPEEALPPKPVDQQKERREAEKGG